jgi:hypothetical protein
MADLYFLSESGFTGFKDLQDKVKNAVQILINLYYYFLIHGIKSPLHNSRIVLMNAFNSGH